MWILTEICHCIRRQRRPARRETGYINDISCRWIPQQYSEIVIEHPWDRQRVRRAVRWLEEMMVVVHVSVSSLSWTIGKVYCKPSSLDSFLISSHSLPSYNIPGISSCYFRRYNISLGWGVNSFDPRWSYRVLQKNRDSYFFFSC